MNAEDNEFNLDNKSTYSLIEFHLLSDRDRYWVVTKKKNEDETKKDGIPICLEVYEDDIMCYSSEDFGTIISMCNEHDMVFITGKKDENETIYVLLDCEEDITRLKEI